MVNPFPDKSEPKISATKAQRHKGLYFVACSWCLGVFAKEEKKLCQERYKIYN